MPDENPEFADIYGVATHVVPDAHDAPRRSVVVHPRSDVVTVLGRTSQRGGFDEQHCMLSEVDLSCRLDLPGMFDVRHKHSIFRAHFSRPSDCEFYGPLGTDEAGRLREFYDRVSGF